MATGFVARGSPRLPIAIGALAQTGTGKTAAFIILIVERLRSVRGNGDQGGALILAPTRELAEQTQSWAQRFGGPLLTALVVGGVAYRPQVGALRSRPSIAVATPGRLVDQLERGTLVLKNVRVLVLDEADRMLDMGFKPQLDRIMRAMPVPRKTLLFTATLPADLGALARMHLRNPVRVDVGRSRLRRRIARQQETLATALVGLRRSASDR